MTSTDTIIEKVTDAARRRSAIAEAGKDRLAELLNEYLNAGDDGQELMRIRAEAQSIDPSVSLDALAFHAATAKRIESPDKALSKARKAEEKADTALEKLRAERDRVLAEYDAKIEQAEAKQSDAEAETVGYQLDFDRLEALKGKACAAGVENFARPVMQRWARLAGIV